MFEGITFLAEFIFPVLLLDQIVIIIVQHQFPFSMHSCQGSLSLIWVGSKEQVIGVANALGARHVIFPLDIHSIALEYLIGTCHVGATHHFQRWVFLGFLPQLKVMTLHGRQHLLNFLFLLHDW